MTLLRQLVGRARATWRVLWRSHQFEREMQDEMRFHVEMEAERLQRERGYDGEEARRLAYIHFGGIEAHKEAGRDARGRRWLDALSTDVRLGVRMLFKHKALTLVGGFAMAVAIGLGATAFEVLSEMLTPALPFDQGDRVVAVHYPLPGTSGARDVLREVGEWDAQLRSIDDLAAFRTIQLNLVAPPAPPAPIRLAEITASGFAVARTRPLHGRPLLPSDEAAGAPPVLVVGYRAWQTHFAADPRIVGRVVTLGGVERTIVGVMPDGFGFPFDHHYWIPFRSVPPTGARSDGATAHLFGRLAPGVSIARAETELMAVAQRDAPNQAERERTRVSVVPYTREHVDLSGPGMDTLVRAGQLLTGVLTLVVAINLAILFYARTVTRAGELAVRTALGASRARLLTQLFLEALALSLAGAAVGLAASTAALRYLQGLARMESGVPYWIQFELSLQTAVTALVLAAAAAFIMGVLPGLKATSRRVNVTLHHSSGRTAPRLGPIWTSLVVGQVAAAVAILPVACYLVWQTVLMSVAGPGFAAEKFAVVHVALPEDGPADAIGAGERQRALITSLREEPGVAAVTFSSHVPGFAAGGRIEFDPQTSVAAAAPWYVSRLDVAADMLNVYGAELLAGRRLSASDTVSAGTAVVNETFAKWIAEGGRVVGARFRYAELAGRDLPNDPWHEIVGVVRDFPRRPEALNLDTPAVVFHAAALGAVNPVFLSVRFDDGIPAGFAGRVRRRGTVIDPALQVRQAVPLLEYYDRLYALWRALSWSAAIMTLSVLLLSAAGMYALMSFTVAQRKREIGIRVALGAQPRRLLGSIFGRALWQLGLGIVLGSLISALAVAAAGLEPSLAAGTLAAVAAIMLAVGVLAAIGPARRSLRVPAADALRSDS
ncbi:MAG TPA: FtsX-like permease family protein [Vicinamibacterales bacterium]|nr:FtsX-like permease family protein [Vicinamibacterales bacterium]